MSEAAAVIEPTPTPAAAPDAAPAPAEAEKPAADAAVEQKQPEPPKPPEPDAVKERKAKDLAALVRKEAAILAEKKALATERERIKAEQAQKDAEAQALRDELQRLKAEREAAKSDPLKALEALGLTVEQINEAVLTGKAPVELQTRALREEAMGEVAKLRAEIEARDKAAEEQRRQAEEAKQQAAAAKMEAWKKGVVDTVSASGAEFKLINHYGQQAAVAELIISHHQSTQRLLDWKEAAAQVEAHIREEVLKAQTLLADEVKAPDAPPSAGTQPAAPQGAQPERKTLSHDLSPSVAASAPALTDEERLERATAHIRARFQRP